MDEKRIKVTVIVPIFEQWHFVPFLFQALERQSFPKDDWEFLLVDNGSATVPEFKRMPSNLRLLRCGTPGSYAARNHALQYANGELIVFTDADCQPCSDWLEQMWLQFTGNESLGTKALIAGDVRMQPADTSAPTTAELFDVFFGLPQDKYVQRGYAVTANLAIPRHIFEEVGEFNQSKLSGGDSEFCHRARRCGAALNFLASAYVIHPARREREELVTKKRRVKGGQMSNIPLAKRLKYGIATFVPPFGRLRQVYASQKLTRGQKRSLGVLLMQLYWVGIFEFFRLLFGGRPERR